ncbi:MAG TPA: hypothetical protein DCG85_05535 [Lachnospiraceae bacterium]|nr:hypothetical protein [Lachnospiraceae bacterium]
MANNMATLSVYNHYLTAYAPKGSTSLDTHKKDELRGIYRSIVKLNKESPSFILDDTDESKEYAVALKENARAFKHAIASMGGLDENGLLNKKAAFSSNEDIVEASFIGNALEAEFAPSLRMEVYTLASEQENMGRFLPADDPVGLAPDTYSFDMSINDLSYEFQFNVKEDESNMAVMQRLTKLINNADIGIKSQFVRDGDNAALRLTSLKSGDPTDKDYFFHVSDTQTSKTSGMVDYLGIGDMTRRPSSALFSINGEEHSAGSNEFTVEKMYEINLKGISAAGSAPVDIGVKNDTESMVENFHKLISGYNSFLGSAKDTTGDHPAGSRLVSELTHIASDYSSRLSEVGINVRRDGSIRIDDRKLRSSIMSDDFMTGGFNMIKSFAKALYQKSDQVSLNPMEYVDKTIVAYKNPGKNFANPYITSAYSGMMFNSYC